MPNVSAAKWEMFFGSVNHSRGDSLCRKGQLQTRKHPYESAILNPIFGHGTINFRLGTLEGFFRGRSPYPIRSVEKLIIGTFGDYQYDGALTDEKKAIARQMSATFGEIPRSFPSNSPEEFSDEIALLHSTH